jgi:hypothetical protein
MQVCEDGIEGVAIAKRGVKEQELFWRGIGGKNNEESTECKKERANRKIQELGKIAEMRIECKERREAEKREQ